jgi:ubiquinone/menaquinone biosynthesis C-methylase UbiE
MVESSFEKVKDWYGTLVGKKGHYYHQSVIFPRLKKWFQLTASDSIIDFGCGQGVLARELGKKCYYLGLDASASLIREAKKNNKSKEHFFAVQDLTEPFSFEKKDFSHGFFLLSLQNMAKPEVAISNASKHIKKMGRCVFVINHPCFRIPRQSDWGVDETQKLLYRRVNRYMTPMEIPIQIGKGQKTFSYHFSFSDLSDMLNKGGFVIEKIEEWCSDKKSSGAKAKMENRARKEFPLFCAISTLLLDPKGQ